MISKGKGAAFASEGMAVLFHSCQTPTNYRCGLLDAAPRAVPRAIAHWTRLRSALHPYAAQRTLKNLKRVALERRPRMIIARGGCESRLGLPGEMSPNRCAAAALAEHIWNGDRSWRDGAAIIRV
jgi:hypothetical protein